MSRHDEIERKLDPGSSTVLPYGAPKLAVVARHKLREYGAATYHSGENGFTYGRLHALEQARADAAEADFEQAWNAVSTRKLRRWTRK